MQKMQAFIVWDFLRGQHIIIPQGWCVFDVLDAEGWRCGAVVVAPDAASALQAAQADDAQAAHVEPDHGAICAHCGLVGGH